MGVLAGLLLVPQMAAAVQTNAATTIFGAPVAQESLTSSTGAFLKSTASSTSNWYAGGAGTAGQGISFASIGALGGRLHATAYDTDLVRGYASITSYANISSHDTLIVTGGAPGTTGYFTALLNIGGTITATVDATPASVALGTYASYMLGLRGTGIASGSYERSGTFTASGTAGSFTQLSIQVPITFGYTTHLDYQIEASARNDVGHEWGTSGSDAVEISMDFTKGVSWGGITGVYNTDGSPVQSYSIVSESGFDYSHPAGGAVAYASWAATAGLNDSDAAHSSAKDADPDKDGHTNFYEFAFGGDPLSGINDGKVVGKVATVGADQVMTLTLPVRTGAVFSPDSGDQLSALIDGIHYRIEGDGDLGTFADTITAVTGGDAATIQTGLPALSSGWSYFTFRSPGTILTTSKAFLRAMISE